MNHPAPSGGFLFFYEGREYRTERMSMLVGELLTLTGGNVMYLFYEQRDGKEIPYSQGQSLCLTDGPRRFYSLPPATY